MRDAGTEEDNGGSPKAWGTEGCGPWRSQRRVTFKAEARKGVERSDSGSVFRDSTLPGKAAIEVVPGRTANRHR